MRRDFITLLGGAATLPRETTSAVKSRCPSGITGGAQKNPELLLGPFADAMNALLICVKVLELKEEIS